MRFYAAFGKCQFGQACIAGIVLNKQYLDNFAFRFQYSPSLFCSAVGTRGSHSSRMNNVHPELFDRADYLFELVDIQWFRKITAFMKAEVFDKILFNLL